MTNSSFPQATLAWLVTIFFPVALILTSVRLLFTPLYLTLEYQAPGFPADTHPPAGQKPFSLKDRLKWSKISMNYLLSDDPIEFFETQRFEDGTRIYNDRELSHMTDVKVVVDWVLRLWILALVVAVGVGVWSWLGGWVDMYKLGLLRGAWVTLGFVGIVVLFVVFAFGPFFVFFHNIFFPPGTWTFAFSDTFIRLFPLRFWQDTFLWVGGLSILQAVFFIWLGKR